MLTRQRLAVSLSGEATIGGRVSLGATKMMDAVVKGHKGYTGAAAVLSREASDLLVCTAPSVMKPAAWSMKRQMARLHPPDISKQLRDQSHMIIVPYHKDRDSLSPGPVATVTCHGCCRTLEEYLLVQNDPDYIYAGVWLLLACSDDPHVLRLLPHAVVAMMRVPLSFDVQHPNKVLGYFSLGFFAYVPVLQRLLTLAMVMFPATDEHLGARAKCGDTVQANSEAKQALDIALKCHLSIAFPDHDWKQFSWNPLVARVSDEGYSGIMGMQSTDIMEVGEASCQFHFKQNVANMKSSFCDVTKFQYFERAALQIAHEPLPALMWAHYAALAEWTSDLPVSEANAIASITRFLLWHFSDKARRERLCMAWRPLEATSSSVAEIGHSSQQHCGRLRKTLNECIVVDAAFAQRQLTCIKDVLGGRESHARTGPDAHRAHDRTAALTAHVQRRVESFSAVSHFPLTGPSTTLESVPTHRHDKQTRDVVVAGKIVYTSKINRLPEQRRIHGIRYCRVDNGRLMFFCNVVGGTDMWVDEVQLDPEDIGAWQQCLSHDELQRCRGVITTEREARFRMIQRSNPNDVGSTFAMSQTVYHRTCRSREDHANVQRALNLEPQDVVVLSSHGNIDTLVMDGQVSTFRYF